MLNTILMYAKHLRYLHPLPTPLDASALLLPLLGQSLAKCVTPPQILQQPPYKKSTLQYISFI